MPWSGGLFSRVHNWVSDASANIAIEADRHDEEDDNLSSGINACLKKDGGNNPTANIDFDGFKIVDLGDATAATDALNRRTGDARYATAVPAQCRVTLTSGVPIMTATVSAATTVYVTPYGGRSIPLYNGTDIAPGSLGGELSQATTDTTKSPAAVTTNSNYDIFVWSDSGTMRATRGPAWSSSTARGTGAGTTELELYQGVYVNKVAITNGPAARYGTYVGSVRSNGSSQIDFIFGASAANGTAALLGVWNMFNRKPLFTMVGDTTDTWTWSPSGAEIRAANASNTMRVSYLSGLDDAPFHALYQNHMLNSEINYVGIGVGYDSTSAVSGVASRIRHNSGNEVGFMTAQHATTSLGWHYMQALEIAVGANTAILYFGDHGSSYQVSGLRFQGMF